VTKRIAKRGDRFIYPNTKKIYIATELVFNGNYMILTEEDGNNLILMSQEDLKTWEPEEKGG